MIHRVTAHFFSTLADAKAVKDAHFEILKETYPLHHVTSSGKDLRVYKNPDEPVIYESDTYIFSRYFIFKNSQLATNMMRAMNWDKIYFYDIPPEKVNRELFYYCFGQRPETYEFIELNK